MIRGMSGCHGNFIILVVFIQGGLDYNKDKVCVSTPLGGRSEEISKLTKVPQCIALLVPDRVSAAGRHGAHPTIACSQPFVTNQKLMTGHLLRM